MAHSNFAGPQKRRSPDSPGLLFMTVAVRHHCRGDFSSAAGKFLASASVRRRTIRSKVLST